MSKKKEEYARLMLKSLEDNAQERKTYIKRAMGSLSGTERASDKEILDKTREIIKDTFRGKVGAKFATTIANGVMLHHINEYKDTIQQARANPPSQPSSSSSSAAPIRLGRQAIIDAALKEEKWRLEPALKRARLHDRTIKIADVKRWRIAKYNLDKRPRKFKSWVANRPFDVFARIKRIYMFDNVRERREVQ